ncbi:low molecular weight phosphotyrosine protein phosphatase [Vibrio agarivorans]|uniref:protein-tyrosine-phosphatase n=1 Tax=Vibrio agarivorans TaxID=153622 RepID=A0ABT7Y0D6_9VIBR|nr:low molecular weight phosphotyrosine protein phosphatase [Vibrio agarivorans]
MFDRILIVCVGNICRSPAAESLLKRLFPNKQINSAGIEAVAGRKADDLAIQVSLNNGFDIQNHKATKLTREMCASYDLILVMEKEHLTLLSHLAPEARGKAFLLGKWLSDVEIPDPYKKSREAFDHVYKLIEQSVHAWSSKIPQ